MSAKLKIGMFRNEMNIQTFIESVTSENPPVQVEETLQSLWYDKKGDWDRAHRIAQEIPSALGSAVHAYLHREEGDIGNARYWYSRAGRSLFEGSLEEEWKKLAEEILGLSS